MLTTQKLKALVFDRFAPLRRSPDNSFAEIHALSDAKPFGALNP